VRLATKKIVSDTISHLRLPGAYIDVIERYLLPIANRLKNQKNESSPMIVGIQGTQGSGKSTTAEFLKLLLDLEFDLSAAVCSIDDFYLDQAERNQIGQTIHPLLKTRGVPGTHHTKQIAEQFARFRSGQYLILPQFDKSTDNPKPRSEWIRTDSSLDILIFEGWCVGLSAQDTSELEPAINALEQNEDPNRVWRKFVNNTLKADYARVFAELDSLVVLKAPSFECVYDWRKLQEQKLISRLKTEGKSTRLTMLPQQLERFIQHYQRLTEHGLRTLDKSAQFILQLDAAHNTVSLTDNSERGVA